ncbi:MAG: acyl carrier protein [Trueperaceae bacterium]|nr:acyl carrier protein [Trueperaceae bacterium]
MDEHEILEKIKDVVADKLDADPADVTEESRFMDDLGADSLDVVELIMGLEDEFGVEISDDEAENIRTVGDAVRFIADKQ